MAKSKTSSFHAEKRANNILTAFFVLLSIAYLYPIFVVLVNSFKSNAAINTDTFALPNAGTFMGFQNYIKGMTFGNYPFYRSVEYSVVITVLSVALILLCTSMAAWYISRVGSTICKIVYFMFVFSMIVPFQMVMFTLSKLADMMGLNTPWGLWIVYLGFGAGLAVFIFTGVVKGIPSELEESAMIDGASVPRIFFQIVLPIMRPSLISVAILQTMWIWNDFLLPYLTLDMRRFKTMSIAIQYLKGGYGSVDMGAMMACLVVAIVPIIIFYLCCQKYIIKGVMAGAVKG